MPQPDPDGLRYYQRDAVDAWDEFVSASAFTRQRRAVIISATGTGKTQMFCTVAMSWMKEGRGRVLILCHRDHLVEQVTERLIEMYGYRVGIEQAEASSDGEEIVVGSIMSVTQPGRLDRLDREGGFTLIITDEGHHYTAPSYRRPLDRWKDAYALGVTATPDRGDEEALGKIFDETIFIYGIEQAVHEGWLVNVVRRGAIIDEIDLSGVKTVAGDFAIGQLDIAMLKAAEGVAKSTLKYAGDRKGIIFTPGVKTAHYLAERLNALQPGCAVSIDAKTPKIERRHIYASFRKGEVRYLVNCMIATEGFDVPHASFIGMARPTKSRSLYAQMSGRGTRPLPGTVDHTPGRDEILARRHAIAASDKPDVLLLDFAGNHGKHDLVHPVDILGGNFSDVERKKAKEKMVDGVDSDVIQMLESARLELMAFAREAKSVVHATIEEFDPFRASGSSSFHLSQVRMSGGPSITGAQHVMLEANGYMAKELEGMTKKSASSLISKVKDRERRGLCNVRQQRRLSEFGIDRKELLKVTTGNAAKACKYTWQKKVKQEVDVNIVRQLLQGSNG